eukprot:CAMPEP_0180143248 /NCGR_PEP_ID=MMETSP0986-20121125/16147_1 /TAXON_ID=697907 /ORGANISM="non described non described, Strain CCMP2293" /LENGTH=67 /DNA_ID=CAMNT_0022086769 /DNA_START=19 /DNA_END=222 /DNA_ORIENTATION=+
MFEALRASLTEELPVQRETQLFNNGINYDPFHPDGYTSMRKDFKAANKVTSLVTKVRNETMFTPHPW